MGDNQAHNVGLLQVPRPEGIGNTPIALTIIGILTLLAIVILIVVIGMKRYRKSKRGERLPIDNTHVGFNHIAGTEEVHLQGQGLHRINSKYHSRNNGISALLSGLHKCHIWNACMDVIESQYMYLCNLTYLCKKIHFCKNWEIPCDEVHIKE